MQGRFTDAAAEEVLAAVRWADNDGKPVCPWCSNKVIYRIKTRRLFRCTNCKKDYSVTTGTIFHGQKIGFKKCLQALALFEANENSSYTITQFAHELGLTYKAGWVIWKKLTEAYHSVDRNGPLSQPPSFLFQGYYQGFNLFRLDEYDQIVRENRKGEKRPWPRSYFAPKQQRLPRSRNNYSI